MRAGAARRQDRRPEHRPSLHQGVANVGYDDPPFVSVYAGGSRNGDGRLRRISGKKTELFWPEGIVVR